MEAADQILIIGFVVGIVKSIREKWPTIDGAPFVVLIAAIAGAVVAAALAVSATGTVDMQTVAKGVVSGVAAVGGFATIDRLKLLAPPPANFDSTESATKEVATTPESTQATPK